LRTPGRRSPEIWGFLIFVTKTNAESIALPAVTQPSQVKPTYLLVGNNDRPTNEICKLQIKKVYGTGARGMYSTTFYGCNLRIFAIS
jgi:hypothetical protein